MAQSALITILKRNLLDNDTIQHNVCLIVEHLSYLSDEHLRNANISVSFLRFILFSFFFYLSFIYEEDTKKVVSEIVYYLNHFHNTFYTPRTITLLLKKNKRTKRNFFS